MILNLKLLILTSFNTVLAIMTGFGDGTQTVSSNFVPYHQLKHPGRANYLRKT